MKDDLPLDLPQEGGLAHVHLPEDHAESIHIYSLQEQRWATHAMLCTHRRGCLGPHGNGPCQNIEQAVACATLSTAECMGCTTSSSCTKLINTARAGGSLGSPGNHPCQKWICMRMHIFRHAECIGCTTSFSCTKLMLLMDRSLLTTRRII